LYYNWHRYYKPTLGRYYQADPLILNKGLNLYTYVSNNPLNLSDPTGLKECCNKLALEKCKTKAKNRRLACVLIFTGVFEISSTPMIYGCVASGELYVSCVITAETIILLPVGLGWITCYYNYFQDVKECKAKNCKKL